MITTMSPQSGYGVGPQAKSPVQNAKAGDWPRRCRTRRHDYRFDSLAGQGPTADGAIDAPRFD